MTRRPNRSAWYTAIFSGVLVFLLLFWFVDPKLVIDQFRKADLLLLSLALLPLSVEALFTSLRVQHCVNHPVPLKLAMYCNAWYIAWLSLLPARLGELAGVAVFKQKLLMPLGSAIASVIVQRIYDVLILSGILVALLSQTLYGGLIGLTIATSVMIILIGVLLTLPFWLGFAASLLLKWRQLRWLKRITYVLLQARSWYRHQSDPGAVTWLAGTTLGKWVVNLSAICLIFIACGLELELIHLATIAVLMHFMGAIPIQSFGGFGAAEVGLAGLLVSLQVPADQAVATSLIVRLTSLSFGALFLLLAVFVIKPSLPR